MHYLATPLISVNILIVSRKVRFSRRIDTQGRTVHRSTEWHVSSRPGGNGGTAIGVPANAFTFYIYFPNGNMSEKANFC